MNIKKRFYVRRVANVVTLTRSIDFKRIMFLVVAGCKSYRGLDWKMEYVKLKEKKEKEKESRRVITR